MEPIILNSLPAEIDRQSLFDSLRLKPGRPVPPELDRLSAEAQRLGRPKAVYLLAGILSKTNNGVLVEGGPDGEVAFESHILRLNLEPAHRLFPYLVTAGVELDDWARSDPDPLIRFYADQIQEQALHSAVHALADHVAAAYQIGPLSRMNPGSLADWPLTQQRPLFSLFGEAAAAIGVQLQPSLLMTPTKTVSGILFESETSFASCQLCPRPNCPNRRAPYDPDLYERRYA